jgi:hypothetical protein
MSCINVVNVPFNGHYGTYKGFKFKSNSKGRGVWLKCLLEGFLMASLQVINIVGNNLPLNNSFIKDIHLQTLLKSQFDYAEVNIYASRKIT